MPISRSRVLLTSATTVFLLVAVLVSVRAQQPGAVDLERAFAFGDTDLDGRLSLDEFRELLRNAPQFKKAAAKNAPARIAPLFQRLDADRDGFLNFPEYRQIAQAGPGGGGPMARARGVGEKATPRPKATPDAGSAPGDRARRPITPEQIKFC